MQCKKLITSSRLKGECHICGNGITRNKYCESGHDGDFHCDDDDDNDNDHNDEWLEASKVCLPNRAELQCLCSFTIMIRVPAVIMMIVFLIKCLSNRAELRFLCRTTSQLIGRICSCLWSPSWSSLMAIMITILIITDGDQIFGKQNWRATSSLSHSQKLLRRCQEVTQQNAPDRTVFFLHINW